MICFTNHLAQSRDLLFVVGREKSRSLTANAVRNDIGYLFENIADPSLINDSGNPGKILIHHTVLLHLR